MDPLSKAVSLQRSGPVRHSSATKIHSRTINIESDKCLSTLIEPIINNQLTDSMDITFDERNSTKMADDNNNNSLARKKILITPKRKSIVENVSRKRLLLTPSELGRTHDESVSAMSDTELSLPSSFIALNRVGRKYEHDHGTDTTCSFVNYSSDSEILVDKVRKKVIRESKTERKAKVPKPDKNSDLVRFIKSEKNIRKKFVGEPVRESSTMSDEEYSDWEPETNSVELSYDNDNTDEWTTEDSSARANNRKSKKIASSSDSTKKSSESVSTKSKTAENLRRARQTKLKPKVANLDDGDSGDCMILALSQTSIKSTSKTSKTGKERNCDIEVVEPEEGVKPTGKNTKEKRVKLKTKKFINYKQKINHTKSELNRPSNPKLVTRKTDNENSEEVIEPKGFHKEISYGNASTESSNTINKSKFQKASVVKNGATSAVLDITQSLCEDVSSSDDLDSSDDFEMVDDEPIAASPSIVKVNKKIVKKSKQSVNEEQKLPETNKGAKSSSVIKKNRFKQTIKRKKTIVSDETTSLSQPCYSDSSIIQKYKKSPKRSSRKIISYSSDSEMSVDDVNLLVRAQGTKSVKNGRVANNVIPSFEIPSTSESTPKTPRKRTSSVPKSVSSTKRQKSVTYSKDLILEQSINDTGIPRRSILKSDSDQTPGAIHYYQRDSEELSPDIELPSKIIHPKPLSHDSALRRSERVRVRPLEWYKNERIHYERRESGGFSISHIDAPTSSRVKEKKRKTIMGNKQRVSMHGELSDSVVFTENEGEVCVVHPETGSDVLVDCIAIPDQFVFCGANGSDAKRKDPLILARPIQQPAFSAGTLVIKGLQEKPRQFLDRDTIVFHIVKGKVTVTIHETTTLIETGGIFFVPSGNWYAIKNLRNDEARLSFTLLKSSLESIIDDD